jgi:DNA polymerase-3 subunit delta'
MEAQWRVLVIDNAETMQGVAQEALLKTLEEPPASVVMLLLAEEADTLLATVRSRCQLVDLRPVPRGVVARALEERGVERPRADEIAGLAGGRPGWALRAIEDAAVVDERRRAVEHALEWMEGSSYDRLVTAVRLGDSFQKRRVKTFDDLDILLGLWRDALLLRVAVPGPMTFRGYAERLQAVTVGWELPALRRAIQAVQTCIADLDANVRPRLAIEAMVLQWPTPSR